MICLICGREGEDKYFEKHHLEPAQKRKDSDTIDVCHQCGDQLHLLFDNNQLKKDFNTLDSILGNERVEKYVKWVRKQPLTKHISTKRKKRRK